MSNIDLEYIVEANNIKENIIVKSPAQNYIFDFTLHLNNLSAQMLSDGSINIYDPKTSEIIYSIPKGYMFDSNKEYSDAVNYSLTDEGNGKYILSVTADATWINDTTRVFPVTIDPTIASSTGSTVTDTYINSYSTELQPSGYSYITAGNTTQLYWKTSVLPNLPNSAYITDANFSLTVYPNQSEISGKYLGAYRVTSNWDSTLTWNKYTSSSEGSLATTYSDFNVINTTSTGNLEYSWNVTDIVKGWYDQETNYGIAVSNISGYSASNISFYSNDYTLSTRPKLTITYKDMKGVEGYWTSTSQSAGIAGTGSINNATGALSFAISTLSTTDSLMPYTPTLVYNSAIAGKYNKYDVAEVPYMYAIAGRGFKWNMNESIVERTYNTGTSDEVFTYGLMQMEPNTISLSTSWMTELLYIWTKMDYNLH